MRKIMIMFFVVALILTGCGGDKSEPTGTEVKAAKKEGKLETPEEAVSNALNAVKNLDSKTINKYFGVDSVMSNNSDITQGEENAKLIVEKLQFEILSSEVNGDIATVKTQLTNIDMPAVLAEFLQQGMSFAFENAFSGNPLSDEELEKKTEQMFIDILSKDGNATTTTTVDIDLSKTGDNWKINLDEQLQNAILGGLLEVAKNMNEGNGN